MSKKLLKSIVKIANVLDDNLLHDMADQLTKVALKIVQSQDDMYYNERSIREPDPEMLENFENSEIFLNYQNKVQSDPSYKNDGELEILQQELSKIFENTDMKSFEDEVLKTLVERNFESRSPKFTAFEEAYEDVAWDVNNGSEFDDISRTPPYR